MSFPVPRPGLVIRYAFLWNHEADTGAEEAAKDRPCAVVVAARRGPSGDILTIVAPITHTPANQEATAIEIPPDVCRMLGLGGNRQWLRFDQLNRFAWPGYDLRSIPGRPGTFDYGMLPRDLFGKMKGGILRLQAGRRVRTIPRD